MNVGIAYANKKKQVWLKLEVPDGSTVREAIDHSGILKQFPDTVLLIAPRHIHRTPDIEILLKDRGIDYHLRSNI